MVVLFSHCKDRAFMWGVQEIFRLFRPDIATGGIYRDTFDEPLPDLSRHTESSIHFSGSWTWIFANGHEFCLFISTDSRDFITNNPREPFGSRGLLHDKGLSRYRWDADERGIRRTCGRYRCGDREWCRGQTWRCGSCSCEVHRRWKELRRKRTRWRKMRLRT